jgi:predicted secreted protein
MSITSAIVLYMVIWFLVLFVVLPLRMRSQGDAGEVVPGTPSSAPDDPRIGRKMTVTTVVSTVLFVVIAGVILSGMIGVEDFDVRGRMGLR